LSGLNFFHDCADTTDKKTLATDEHRFSQISEKKESLALSVSVFICVNLWRKNSGNRRQDCLRHVPILYINMLPKALPPEHFA